MNKKLLVQYFVDGTQVDFELMVLLGLICKINDGFVLTKYGKSCLKN